jgi:tetrahedral aminopeptidase
MKDLIIKLTETIAPSGAEKDFQNTLLNLVKDVADEVFIDRLGNGVARKHGDGPHIMLAAHADEAGVMVIDVDANGYLRLISVGDVSSASLIGRHIRFTNGITGVVGVEKDVKLQDVHIDNLYVDIAADSRETALARVFIGLEGVIAEEVVSLDEHRIAGRALDNRVGCAVAIEAFRNAAAEGKNVSLVFSSQSEVGGRGAKTAAYQLLPDLAIVIDAAPAGDMPDAPRMELALGQGPAIKIMDKTAIVPLRVKDHLIESAKRAGVAIQYEVWAKGMTDAGSIQLAVDGILVGGLSYPARYVGGPSTIVDVRDAEAAVALLSEAIRSFETA